MTRRPGGLMSEDGRSFIEALREIRITFDQLSKKDGETAIRILQRANDRKE